MKEILKRIIPVFLFLVLISTSVNAQMQFKEIESETDWENALAEAKSEGKLIFIDIYATWCGPCKYLESDIYPDSLLGDYYNSHFINLKMDGESAFGRIKAREYGLKAYPSMYYLGSSEVLLSQVVGVKQAPELIEHGTKIVSNLSSLLQLRKDFVSDKMNEKQLFEYRSLLIEYELEDKSNEVAGKLLNFFSDEDILNPEYKSIVMTAPSNIDGNLFKLMKENQEKIAAVWTPDEIDNLYEGIFGVSVGKAVSENNMVYKDRIINELIPVYMGGDAVAQKGAEYYTNKLFFARTGKWKDFEELINAVYTANNQGNDMFLYSEASEITSNYLGVPEAAVIAQSLMSRAVDINPSFDNLLLFSYLNGVVGNIEKANESLLKAEEMAVTEDQNKILNQVQAMIDQLGQ